MNTTTLNIHQDLIEGCRKNNRKSQLQIYNLYYKAMYNTAYRIIKQSAEAEDVMQESFLAAFQKLNEYKGDATFGAWLKRIVINRSLDFIRKKKEMISIEEVGEHLIVDDMTENYLEVLSYKVEEIRKGIETLSDEDRVIISLFLLEGYDHAEISDILNISSSTSRVRYSRAKQRLRDKLNMDKINEMVN